MTVAPSALAPIALFAYARLDHLQRTVASLQANPLAGDSLLTIYCDAARTPAHAGAVDAVRAFAKTVDGFAGVRLVLRSRNLGLAASIIDGVGTELESSDRVIVVEDDLVTSPHFLRYMNDGLEQYAEDAAVASIHAYCFPVPEPLPETFFLRGADCWGWATWRRAWRHFEPDGAHLMNQLEQRRLTRAFDLDNSFPFTAMLQDQIAGRNDSWAVRWHASAFLASMLTLYPGRSLVHNIGNDASGTHSGRTDVYAQVPSRTPVHVERQSLLPSEVARRAFARFLRHAQGGPLKRLARAVTGSIRSRS